MYMECTDLDGSEKKLIENDTDVNAGKKVGPGRSRVLFTVLARVEGDSRVEMENKSRITYTRVELCF